jgi:hypothetical protein
MSAPTSGGASTVIEVQQIVTDRLGASSTRICHGT